jgi:hypothetical protein
MDTPWLNIGLITENWKVIEQNPSLIIATVTLGVGAGLAWSRRRISILTERWNLAEDRVKDYEARLNGASPADAAKQIAALEMEIKRQARRQLSPEQMQILAEVGQKEEFIQVRFNPADGEAEEYAKQFWGLGFRAFFPSDSIPLTFKGVALRVKDTNRLPPIAEMLARALAKAGIPFIKETAQSPVPNGLLRDDHCELVIGRKE